MSLDTTIVFVVQCSKGGVTMDKKESRTTIRLSDELRALLYEEAKRQNRSVHNLMITILMDYFKKCESSSEAHD